MIPWKIGTGNIIVKKIDGTNNVTVSSDTANTTGNTRTQTLTFTNTENSEDISTLTVSQEPIDDPNVFNQKSVWWHGITPPNSNEWIRCYPNFYTTYYLPFSSQNNNWWDVNKENPTAETGGVKDGNMCWAAAASDLLHWWIYNNIDYIKQYNYQGPNYEWHSDQSQESDIFALFRDTFEDEAGYTDEGLNWFIHGTEVRSPSQLPSVNNPGGFFKDVFPDGVNLGKSISGNGKEIFNNTIKDAIANNKAIGISVGNIKSSHAVVIWGVEFDDTDTVSHIYLADNNDRDGYESFGYGCIRLKMEYYKSPEGAIMIGYNTGYIGGPYSYKPIIRLVTLDLGTEYWKSYLGI